MDVDPAPAAVYANPQHQHVVSGIVVPELLKGCIL